MVINRIEKEVKRKMGKKMKNGQEKLIFSAILGGIALIILFLTIYTIPAGYRGVILTFGKPSDTIAQEGINFKIPFVQTVKKYEVRTQKIETQADSASLDLQDVQTTIALNFYLNPEEVNRLHQEIGRDYQVRIIDPAIQEAVKSMSAQFRAEDLIQKRPEAKAKMQELLTEKLKKYHIIVKDFNIVNFQFSETFDEAVEKKVVAEQKKLEADRDLERIKVEKEQIITQAQAEAEALRLQKEHISPELIQLREIEVKRMALEVQREAIEKWDGILPQVTSGIPFIGFDLSNFNEVEQR